MARLRLPGGARGSGRILGGEGRRPEASGVTLPAPRTVPPHAVEKPRVPKASPPPVPSSPSQEPGRRPAPPSPTARSIVTEADRLERAAAFINERARRISGSLLEIGEFLLRELFDGDPERVMNRDPVRMQSFRTLAERDDVALGFVTLWRSVQLAVQERWLRPMSSADQRRSAATPH